MNKDKIKNFYKKIKCDKSKKNIFDIKTLPTFHKELSDDKNYRLSIMKTAIINNDKWKFNPFEIYELFNIFLEDSDFNQKDYAGWTIMMYLFVHQTIVGLDKKQMNNLLKKCDINIMNNEKETLFMRLIMESPLLIEKKDFIQLLQKIDLNQQDENNNSLFSYLLTYNKLSLLDEKETLLLLNKTNYLLKDNVNTTVLEYIIKSYLNKEINIKNTMIQDMFKNLNEKDKNRIFENVINKYFFQENKDIMMFLLYDCNFKPNKNILKCIQKNPFKVEILNQIEKRNIFLNLKNDLNNTNIKKTTIKI